MAFSSQLENQTVSKWIELWIVTRLVNLNRSTAVRTVWWDLQDRRWMSFFVKWSLTYSAAIMLFCQRPPWGERERRPDWCRETVNGSVPASAWQLKTSAWSPENSVRLHHLASLIGTDLHPGEKASWQNSKLNIRPIILCERDRKREVLLGQVRTGAATWVSLSHNFLLAVKLL